MTQPSPLATVAPWDLVSAAYVAEVVPVFAGFAEDALRLAGVKDGDAVLDVAAGPGTLAFLAAKRGARVQALDFSPRMIDALRARADRERVAAVEGRIGDGQELPFEAASFDSAFSMFGLMFFPDRARGFRELRRVTKPGGRIVVSSWVPMDRVPILAEVFGAIRELLPGMPFGAPKAPLCEPADFQREMAEAGLSDVTVHEVEHGFEATSAVDFWDTAIRSNAAVAVLKERLGDKWLTVDPSIRARLREKFGDGPHHVAMFANLGVARA